MKKVKRKKFIKGIAAGTIALPFVIRALGGGQAGRSQSAPGVISQKKYKWRMVTTWPPNFPVVGEGCNLFARWVGEMSGGRMEIKVYGGGELVPALEVFDAVRNNSAELGNGASYYWVGKVPAATFFTTIPFGMNAQQANAWMMSGGGLQLWEQLYSEFGLLPIPAGNTGFQMGGWFNKEINSMADFQGLKMRMPGLGAKVLQKAGATPVLLAGGELFTGLERGVIDATEWIGPYHDYLMGFHQIAKYYYSPGWHETGSVLECIVNREKFEALPNDLQQIIRTAAYRANHWVLSEFEAKNATYLEKLIREENVDVRQFPKEVLARLKEYTRETLEEITATDPFSKKVYESYRAFAKKASVWAGASEKIYYDELMVNG